METKLNIKKKINWSEENEPISSETKIILNGIDLSDKVLEYTLKQNRDGIILDISIVIDEIDNS